MPGRRIVRRPPWRAVGVVALVGASAAVPAAASSPSPGTLQSRIAAAHAREKRLAGAVAADQARSASFNARIGDLQQRLAGLEASLAAERTLLVQVKYQLRQDRARLFKLRLKFAADRQVLASQLVSAYEADRPDLVTVVLNAHGFADLLESADAMRAVSDQNAAQTARVRSEKQDVAVQTVRMGAQVARQQQITQATSVQHEEVAQVRTDLVSQQMQFIRAGAQKSAVLASVRARAASLEHEFAAAQAQAASVSAPAGAGAPAATGAPFTGASGSYGFFPAPGTNYSVGEEPTIASRLNTMGRALQLHLIGISGYRSPQHSVEVGGFANDPHTRGQASDTPGVEGVAEATLNRYGLTRPFPGAAEADHIQLLGG